MAEYVIDSSSVLAFAFGEPGMEAVAEIASSDDNRLLISAISMAEVLTRLIDKGMSLETALSLVAPLLLEEVSYDQIQARMSAQLREATRTSGLSLGDRACLGLAVLLKAAVLTADRKWLEVSEAVGAEVIITRPKPH